MKLLICSVLVCMILTVPVGNSFNIIGVNRQILYEYIGSVSVGAKAPQDGDNAPPPSSGWIVRGKLTLQRQNENTLAAALAIDAVTLNNSGEKFLQNKEMYPPYKPFKIVLGKNGSVSHLVFKESDPIWSTNFKRAIASSLQFQMDSPGAFVVEETGIHGKCTTEYYISNRTNYLSIRKTPELKSCTPYAEAIHFTRCNVPPNLCEFDFQKSVIVGNEAQYGLLPHSETGYFLSVAHVKGTALVHTFESTGEAQYINSELLLNFLNETTIDNPIDIETGMTNTESSLEFQPLDLNDPTGGRHPQQQETLIQDASELFNSLAEGLESSDLKFHQPFDSTVSDIIKIMSQMNLNSLQKLFLEVDIGTSYRQETIRNIFFEIIPRIGTKASVLLTRDLVLNKQVKPTTSVQLLMSLPFHIFELSHELVKECETFLTLGPDRPDVRQAAVLSFATLVHNVFVAGYITKDDFEVYVQKYFNLYLSGHDYEQKMLYIQALSNLQLGNVANYLDPIIRDENENDDIKFLAAWTTMSLAHTRPEKIYEIYWPIFESRNASLEMRVAAVTLLLISNPTPARLISLHRILQDETSPHLINFYRTTVKSISETTYPCYQHLRRMLSYMYRHLPPAPESRYWVTGNYIFDYRDSKFGIGAMLQAFLVGDPKSDQPVVAYFKFDTEALGRFTGQLALYLKLRGVSDELLDRVLKPKAENINLQTLSNILEAMKAPKVSNTPMHLEFILQMEGKTVLSYHINEKTFHNLTYGEMISRVNFLIQADSHINMQTVRWPFMTKYSVPTVLGTSAEILLQTTVLTSLRGNITQHMSPNIITRSNEIDVRYSSYALCKSRSYNPFLNLEHEINREQGLLAYIPLNNDLSVNITSKSLKFAFSRPGNLTSGLSFKSRSVTSTKGFITRSSIEPYEEVITPEKKNEVFELFKYYINDIGLSATVNTNFHEINSYRSMLFKSEFMENGFSSNMAINTMMYLFGIAQLSSIHIGNDRNFTFLVHNIDFTKIEGSLNAQPIEGPGDKSGHKIDFSLIHKNSVPDKTLHKWNVILNLVSSRKLNSYKLTGIVKRTNNDEDDWKACLDLTYNDIVFMVKPHAINGAIVFGKSSGEKGCPQNASKVEISAKLGPSGNKTDFFKDTNTSTDANSLCPRDVLKLNPPPTTKYCRRKNFEDLTTIRDFNADLKFDNMPEWFDIWANRLDHFVSVFSERKVDHLNLGKAIDISVRRPSDAFSLAIDINGVSWRMYHIPFIPKIDAKYDTTEQFLYDLGLKRSCSLIRNIINTFDDTIVMVDSHLPSNSSCSTLLVAECSNTPRMAIFLTTNKSNSTVNYKLKVFIGDSYFTFEPAVENQDDFFIMLNGKDKINIRDQPYQFPILERFYDFRVEINEQNILDIDIPLVSASVQFDMLNIINIEISETYKNKMCGLCSLPLNQMSDYNYCSRF